MLTEETKKRILEEYMTNGSSRIDMFQRFTEPLIHAGDAHRAMAKRLFEGVNAGLVGDDLFRWMGCEDKPEV